MQLLGFERGVRPLHFGDGVIASKLAGHLLDQRVVPGMRFHLGPQKDIVRIPAAR